MRQGCDLATASMVATRPPSAQEICWTQRARPLETPLTQTAMSRAEAVDKTGDLTQELILGGKVCDSVDLLGSNCLTLGNATHDLQNALDFLANSLQRLRGLPTGSFS